MSADPSLLINLLRSCLVAREVDRLEAEFTARGEAFFHVAGVGHSASVALAPCLLAEDLLHLHYRDKALMVARGITAEDFFLALFCKETSHSAGRQMSAHMAAPDLGVLSLVGPVGNNALQAVGAAAALARRPLSGGPRPLVVCALGDGTSQQGEVLEAISHAVRDRLPVLFLIEDNRLAISVRTAGRTFYETPDGPQSEFLGRPIHRLDGRQIPDCQVQFERIVAEIRSGGGPAIVVLQTERLTDHTNADNQASYRELEEVESARREADPTSILQGLLINRGHLTPQQAEEMGAAARQDAREAAARARRAAEPAPCREAIAPWPDDPAALPYPLRMDGVNSTPAQPTLLEAVRQALDARLAEDQRVTLFGQDIEDPKGDVFGITRGLSTRHGRERVTNSPLAESTIVGVAVGRALAGERPVAMLQFADFIPIAFNQIACEMATIPWRTNGLMRMPVIVMAPCGAYKPGLGHFHAQTNDSLMAHVPGLDVAVPSSPSDAAGLLNAAFAAGRPTVFLYPKALLNDRDIAAAGAPFDPATHMVPFGKAALARAGRDVTLVTWGNGVKLCLEASAALSAHGVECEVLDLRTLAPWDRESVLTSARRTGRLVVVHEDSMTGGFGAEIVAVVAERAGRPVAVRRVARPDVPIPCHYPSQLEVLPSIGAVEAAVADLLGLEHEALLLSEEQQDGDDEGVAMVPAVGTSPTDEQIRVTRWLVRPGDHVVAGAPIADIEADKASGEIASPVAGVVLEYVARVGEEVKVGAPLLRVRADTAQGSQREGTVASARYQPPRRRLLMDYRPGGSVSADGGAVPLPVVVMSRPFGAPGTRIETNEQLVQRFPGRTVQEIAESCGVMARVTAGPGESVTTLAWRAVRSLQQAHPGFADTLGLVIAATETADAGCPSLAALCLQEVQRLHGAPVSAAPFDLNAACSGWLYAIRVAYDHIQHQPGKTVLIVTADVMTPLLAPDDFSTRILFGDAATATLVGAPGSFAALGISPAMECHRPVILGHPDAEGALTCPTPGRLDGQRLHMNGPKVYREAVKAMGLALKAACGEASTTLAALDVVIPHQANQRILDAVERQFELSGRVYSALARTGNTSASSIPLAIETLLADRAAGLPLNWRNAAARSSQGAPTLSAETDSGEMRPPRGSFVAPSTGDGAEPAPAHPALAGLAAFGGGFTYAAAVARILP